MRNVSLLLLLDASVACLGGFCDADVGCRASSCPSHLLDDFIKIPSGTTTFHAPLYEFKDISEVKKNFPDTPSFFTDDRSKDMSVFVALYKAQKIIDTNPKIYLHEYVTTAGITLLDLKGEYDQYS